MNKISPSKDKDLSETNVTSEEDYNLIEGALLQNPRGRWFLEEYIQRNRPEDTQKLLQAIQRIENNLQTQQEPVQENIDPIRMSIIEMSKAIAKTRNEIKSIKPSNGEDDQIITATEELGAIVEATENATNTILEAAEEIQEAAWLLREAGADDFPCNKIDEKTTDIYTACSFQDITGQRTTKVVQALCYIENRVNAMIDIWDLDVNASDDTPIRPDDNERDGSHLLNGPAMKGEGLEQDSIDGLLENEVTFDEISGYEDLSSSDPFAEAVDPSLITGQDLVDTISFDSVGTEAETTSEFMNSDDLDLMSFDAIEPEHPATEQTATDDLSFDEINSEENFESNVAIDRPASEVFSENPLLHEIDMDDFNENNAKTDIEITSDFTSPENSDDNEQGIAALNPALSIDETSPFETDSIDAGVPPFSQMDISANDETVDKEVTLDFGDIEVSDTSPSSEASLPSESNEIPDSSEPLAEAKIDIMAGDDLHITTKEQLETVQDLSIEDLTDIQEEVLLS